MSGITKYTYLRWVALTIIVNLLTGVLICTIEKANLLVSRMVEEEVLGSLGMVVVDELHMVGDEQRGYLLELLLTKLRYSTIVSEETAGATVHAGLQIVGMSATMPNGTAIAQWLGAELYETDFRPVPLRQYLKVCGIPCNQEA